MSFAGDLSTVLRSSRFRRLFAVRLSSQTGDGVFQLALASYVLFSPERQATAGRTAALFATLLLPYSLVGPFAGVFIDRWRRQRILLVANLIRAAMVVCVALLIVGGSTGKVFFVVTLAVLSVNRFFLAALSAALPHVVPYELLVMGNSLTTSSGTLAAVAGGAIGLGVRSVAGQDNAGIAIVMFTGATFYLASSLCATSMDSRLLGPDREGVGPRQGVRDVLRDITAGARHVWAHRRAGHALIAITAHRFFYGISTISTVLLYRNYFPGGGTDTLVNGDTGLAGLAAVLLASGIGYLAAALITPVATRRLGEERWIVGLFGAAAVIEIVLGVPYRNLAFIGAAFFLGIVAQGSKITVDAVVQESIDDAYRGRVFSFYDILFNVSFVSAAAFGALTLPSSGKSYAVLVFIAVGYAVTASVYAWRTVRLAQTDPVPAEEAPA
ncbi:MAG: MFS transporter [Pseudonocardiales bacterium]|nr:MAG: MFS transporter [Pseudonocardiales bacterium]